MGQDPKDLTFVTCDICGKQIAKMDKHVRWQTYTLYSGAIGQGVYICQRCLLERFAVKKEALRV